MRDDELLAMYCGMGTSGAGHLSDVREGKAVPVATLTSMCETGLAVRGADGNPTRLTLYGEEIYWRASGILGGDYRHPQSPLNMREQDELEGLNLRGVYRRGCCVKHGLHSVHVKLLRSLALRPGQAWRALMYIYGRVALDDLANHALITRATRPFDQVTLTAHGLDLVREILA